MHMQRLWTGFVQRASHYYPLRLKLCGGFSKSPWFYCIEFLCHVLSLKGPTNRSIRPNNLLLNFLKRYDQGLYFHGYENPVVHKKFRVSTFEVRVFILVKNTQKPLQSFKGLVYLGQLFEKSLFFLTFFEGTAQSHSGSVFP